MPWQRPWVVASSPRGRVLSAPLELVLRGKVALQRTYSKDKHHPRFFSASSSDGNSCRYLITSGSWVTYDKHIRGGAVLTKQQKVCFLDGVINFDDYFFETVALLSSLPVDRW